MFDVAIMCINGVREGVHKEGRLVSGASVSGLRQETEWISAELMLKWELPYPSAVSAHSPPLCLDYIERSNQGHTQ